MTIRTLIIAGAAAMLTACSPECDKPKTCDGQCAPADSMNIVLDLHRKVKPECVAEFKASFAECKESTLKEPGCIDYGVYQSTEDTTEFLIHEEWANQAALDSHGQTEHMKKHSQRTKDVYTAKSGRRIVVCPQVQ